MPVLTVAILFAFDLLLRQVNIADCLACRSIDLWDVPNRIVLCEQIKPEVATIGSSLLMVVSPIDLAEQLSRGTKQQIKCMNFCSGTQMVSEVFMIVEALVARTRDYPRVLIFGTCVRDFVNDMYALEWTGESFNSIAPYVPVDPQSMSHIFSVNAQQQLWLCHFWYLYRNRLDFKNILFAWTKDALEVLPLDEPFERLGPDRTWRGQKEGILYERWIPRKMGSFTAQIDQNDPKFLLNYYKEYQQKMWKDERGVAIEIEGHYFMKLIEFCRAKGIKLVVVNMPVSKEMESIAPAGRYKSFAESLKEGEKHNQFYLVDLTGDPVFTESMFLDGLHLNPVGAHIVAEKLAEQIKTRFPEVMQKIAEQEYNQKQEAELSH